MDQIEHEPLHSTSSTASCAHGCIVRGHHTASCMGECAGCRSDGGHRRACDRTCGGCRPRQAEFGQLCAWCWQRLHADLVDAPGLVAHLREVAEPDAGARPLSENPARSDPAETAMLSAAVDAADELHGQIAAWALLIIDEHPAGLAGPDRRDWWTSHGRLAVLDDGETYTSRPRVVGIRRPRPDATQRLVAWLLPHLEWASRQPWIGDMRAELKSLVSTTHARWPQVERPRHVAGIPCARCNQLTLTYSPPAAFKHPFVVTCTNPDCGRVFSEAEWDAHLARHMASKIGRGRRA